MSNVNIIVVIVISIIISAITSQIVFRINSKFLNKKLQRLQYDIIDGCTDKVVDYIKNNFRRKY